MNKITVNKEQKLYVIPCGKGYTCLGFEVCKNRVQKLADEMGIALLPHRTGSIAAYNQYTLIMEKVKEMNVKTGFRSKSELIPEFIGNEGRRVEIIDKYDEKRRFYIGKSTGWIPCHLEVLRSNSTGGGSVTGYPFKSFRFV